LEQSIGAPREPGNRPLLYHPTSATDQQTMEDAIVWIIGREIARASSLSLRRRPPASAGSVATQRWDHRSRPWAPIQERGWRG